ncbi:MAG: ABC transporter permease subunit [Proteobacteria bacterium]|nr:ABC transporter permease subunit [Pseudomonadota bacterium]
MTGRSERHAVLAVRLATVLALWGAWELLARSGLLYEGVVPSSLRVAAALAAELGDPLFYRDALWTAYEIVAGFALGTLAGVAAGIALGARRFAAAAAGPYIHGLASTPKIVFLPIVMLLCGVGAGSKIGMAALSAFFPVVIAAIAGMAEVDAVLVRVARSFNASASDLVRKVYLPSLVVPVTSGMRLGLGVATIGVLLAEIKFSDRGLGHRAIQHYQFFRVADMYAVLLATFALAVAANALMGRLARRR